MKTLSVRNPYAALIVAGIKTIENRSWSTRYRGPLLIHAGVTPHLDSIDEVERRFNVCVDKASLRFGGIIGSAVLIDVVTKSSSPWFVGPYGFVLSEARPLEFLALRGRQRFFDAQLAELS